MSCGSLFHLKAAFDGDFVATKDDEEDDEEEEEGCFVLKEIWTRWVVSKIGYSMLFLALPWRHDSWCSWVQIVKPSAKIGLNYRRVTVIVCVAENSVLEGFFQLEVYHVE